MNIQILNNDLSIYGIVTGFISLDFTRALNSQGSFKISINFNNKTAKYLAKDKIVYIDDNTIGYIDKVTLSQNTNKSKEILSVEGMELKDRLDRLIYPSAGEATDSYTNEYLETVVKSLILKNAGSSASSDRQISNLVLAADQSRGTQIDYSARYKNLSTELYTLLASQNMGLKAKMNFPSTEIEFDVFQGNDLTTTLGTAGGIALSLDANTALASSRH